MFRGCTSFQSDVTQWNGHNATVLESMFEDCTAFQSDVSQWNASKAIDLSQLLYMFGGCSFSKQLSPSGMRATRLISETLFCRCTSFQSDISRWNVGRATDLQSMFNQCPWSYLSMFNQCQWSYLDLSEGVLPDTSSLFLENEIRVGLASRGRLEQRELLA